MFDDLRQKSAQEAEFINQETVPAMPAAPSAASARVSAVGRSGRGMLGLTPVQGFALALMLFLNVTVLGCLALVVFEKIALPFF
jgi:hypothetical protein